MPYQCPKCQYVISNNKEELITVERFDLGEIEYKNGFQEYWLGCPKCKMAYGELWNWID